MILSLLSVRCTYLMQFTWVSDIKFDSLHSFMVWIPTVRLGEAYLFLKPVLRNCVTGCLYTFCNGPFYWLLFLFV